MRSQSLPPSSLRGWVGRVVVCARALAACHRVTVRLFICLSIAFASIPTLPSPSYAESCGSLANRQAGWGTAFYAGGQPRRWEGAKVSLIDEGGYVLCTSDNGPNNFSTSWSMIYGGNGGYAQSGTRYEYSDNGCVRRWAEQRQSASTGFVDVFLPYGCSAFGETHDYWQQSIYINGGWRIRSNIDTTIIIQSPWSPFSWTGNYQVAFSSETYYQETHIPGAPATKQAFTNLQVQDRVNDSWYNTCGNANLGLFNNVPSGWGVDSLSCNYTRSWTN